MRYGFEFEAARSKKQSDDDRADAPGQVAMRPDAKIARNPSTDQKKVRRQMARQASQEEPMHTEAQLLAAMSKATLAEQREIAAELDGLRRAKATAIQEGRDTELSAMVVRAHLTPVRTHALNTTATDWMEEVADTEVDNAKLSQHMRTEASLWFRRTSAEVRQDAEEFEAQLSGYAARLASQYGMEADTAYDAFTSQANHLKLAEEGTGAWPLDAPGPQNGNVAPWTDKPTTNDSQDLAELPEVTAADQSGNASSGLPLEVPLKGNEKTSDEEFWGEYDAAEVPSTRAPMIQENMDGSNSERNQETHASRVHAAEGGHAYDGGDSIGGGWGDDKADCKVCGKPADDPAHSFGNDGRYSKDSVRHVAYEGDPGDVAERQSYERSVAAGPMGYTCPTCKEPNLSAGEKRRGFQCRNCTRSDEGYGFTGSKKTASEHKCSRCGKDATLYAFEEGSRASGMFLCESDRSAAGDRTVESIGSEKTSSIGDSSEGTCDKCGAKGTVIQDRGADGEVEYLCSTHSTAPAKSDKDEGGYHASKTADNGSIECGACKGQGVRNHGGAWVNCTVCGGSGVKKQVVKKNPDLKDTLPDHKSSTTAAAPIADPSGQGQSGLDDVEVGDEDDRPAWPWELDKQDKGAADVANADNPNDHSKSSRRVHALPAPGSASEYKAQCARDAQARGYGDQSYWDMLDKSSQEKYDYFAVRGDMEQAQKMLTRSLSESLMGNDGD